MQFHGRSLLFASMGLKTITAFCAGMLLQLSVVAFGIPTGALESVRSSACPSSCCENLDSCPCFESSGQDEAPAPLPPAPPDLKGPLARPSEPVALVIIDSPTKESPPTACVVRNSPGGYSGVPLTVAFCSFVI